MTKKIYLDYAATTPVSKEVLKAMTPYFSEKFGNAGSLHAWGQEASRALDATRESLARELGADFREIIFTGSATEANNLALRGAVKRFRSEKPEIKPKLIVSVIEHESVLATAADLRETEAAEIRYLPVNREGFIDLSELKDNLDKRTVLVSLGYANNEIGVINPIREAAKIIKEFRGSNTYPLIHTDAVQAFQFLPCRPKELGVDLMTLSAHKVYGPKGVGLLYLKTPGKGESESISPILSGGGQEFGWRSGTENVASLVGFAKAAELISAKRLKESKRLGGLRNDFWRRLKKAIPEAELNGPAIDSPLRLANNLNIFFRNHSAQELLVKLDLKGLAPSSGSACRSRSPEPSYVIEALGLEKGRAKSSLRISLGRPTTASEIKAAVRILAGMMA